MTGFCLRRSADAPTTRCNFRPKALSSMRLDGKSDSAAVRPVGPGKDDSWFRSQQCRSLSDLGAGNRDHTDALFTRTSQTLRMTYRLSCWTVANPGISFLEGGGTTGVRISLNLSHCHPIISCFIKIQIGLTFLVSAWPLNCLSVCLRKMSL